MPQDQLGNVDDLRAVLAAYLMVVEASWAAAPSHFAARNIKRRT